MTSRALQSRKWQLIGKSQWCCSGNCSHPLHALTYNWTRSMQLANTLPLQSTAPGLHPVSIHQMAPPVRGNAYPITAYYSVYLDRMKGWVDLSDWLHTEINVPPPGVEVGHVTHPSTNRARRRVTSLIRPTPLPLRHAVAVHLLVTYLVWRFWWWRRCYVAAAAAVACPLSVVRCTVDHVGPGGGESGASHQGAVAAGESSPV